MRFWRPLTFAAPTSPEGAHLAEADLKGAKLHSARLDTPDGRNPVKGLTVAQLSVAAFDRLTVLPKELRDAVDG